MKKNISAALAVCLVLLSILPFFHQAYALTIYRTVTKYHLDMGVIHIWSSDKGATWQNNLKYGTTPSEPFTASLTFPNKIQKVVTAYVLDEGDFKWDDSTGVYTFNTVENYLTSESTYSYNYKRYMSNSISSIKPIQTGDFNVELSYKAKLTGYQNSYDLAAMLNAGKFDDIINLLGGKNSVKQDLYDKLEDGKDGVGESVLGYMFFIPIVIEYQVIEKVTLDIGEFEAGLDAPEKVLVGETFNVTDQSIFGDESEFAETQLRYCVDGGSTKSVTGWKGNALREAIKQSFDMACTVEYTITTWNKYGDSDTTSKTVRVLSEEEAEEAEIEVEADLVLPEYTYEGHTETASDQSTFVVDGVDYSAARTYAEGLARSSYKASSSTVSVHKSNNTRAECTFSQKGTYDITLDIRADGGARASDTESIEVRKTPYIIDTLSGFQKQNRKQVLTITVATYPGKPLTKFSIDLKDKVTGEQIRLTQDNLQENNATIKTRAVTMEQDLEKGFAYITLEFLTKTPTYRPGDPNYTQDFYYEIHVKDSKGDTDQASKTFPVKPDLPPVPAISMDTAFLRNEGTNFASIKTEDVTVAVDGDEVERTWYFGHGLAPASYTNVATMDGYQKLSFGTDKIVGFHKVGVGKFTTKLFVKEKWTEPTLEEYVTDADHLTGVTTAPSDVFNVAPIVSLEMMRGAAKDVLLLANNDSEYQTLINNKTALKQSLLANKIDGQIVIKKLLGSAPSDVTGITTKLNLTFPAPRWLGTSMTEEDAYYQLANDSEKAYLSAWTWVNNEPTVPVSVQAYNPYTGMVWQYTTTKNERFTFGQDDEGRYLYLIYSESKQTVLLDKRTGTVAGTLNVVLTDKVWMTDDSFFTVENGSLCRTDKNTLVRTTIDTGVSAFARVGNDFQYITKTTTGVIKNTFDMRTLTVKRHLLSDTDNGKGSSANYTAVSIDAAGTVVLFKEKGTGTDPFNGIQIYSPDNKLVKEIPVNAASIKGVYGPPSETGTVEQVVIHSEYENYRSYFTGVNLNTGAATSEFRVNTYGASSSFSACFTSGGVTYLYSPGWYLTGGLDYCGSGFAVAYNGTSMSLTDAGRINSYDGKFEASDRIFTTMFGDNSSTNATKIKISALPKTLAQETAEVIRRFSNKETFIGNTSTTADQIKASIDMPKPMVKISANNNGNLSLSNLSLVPGKKYYYEYDIRPLTDGTKSNLTGITASTGTNTSNQSFLSDSLYVTESYEENFNGGPINPFFIVNDPGRFVDGKYGAYYGSSKDKDDYVNLSFTVPSGKEAIVSFDYKFDYSAASYYSGTNIFVDGLRMDERESIPDVNAAEGSKVFYKILSAGTHTIEIKVTARSWWYVLMDNLKVDILSTTPDTSVPMLNLEASADDWLTLSGDFKIPTKTVSYGAQASTYEAGPLPSVVTTIYTAWSNSQQRYVDYPEEIEYYQNVPSGYLQKAYLYLKSDSLYRASNYYLYGKSYSLDRNVIHDLKIFLPPIETGQYTHKVWIRKPESDTISFYWAERVTYPDNAVTRSGNMAFNSSNTKYFFPKVTSTGKTNLSMYIPKGEYYLKNLQVYYMENGQRVYLENKDLENITELPNWGLSSGLTASNVSLQEEEKDDEYIKIYKKGEKVLYNIFYDDYEEDPSKVQYWQYSHINWPPDNVHPDVGKVMAAPIDRFYLSGKYTVTHWQQDNTQRTGTVGDATPYNKESNKVSLTFYIDGEGKAPWITYIKTDPTAVKENNNYAIKVGIDDSEKDTLTLEAEVYLNGKIIKTDVKTGITANSAGAYPEQTISGLPKAACGVHQVICTVSDYSGTGIKSYKFTVVSEGKITGFVNHTDKWDVNRKKYNVKRFQDEVNRLITMNEYLSKAIPRPRGINVFWSGEQFMLLAETEGTPSRVTVKIMEPGSGGTLHDTGNGGELRDTGRKTLSGAGLWEGSLWNQTMINRWGRKEPEELTFVFTAHYSEGITKTHTVTIIVDTERDYWQLHRLW